MILVSGLEVHVRHRTPSYISRHGVVRNAIAIGTIYHLIVGVGDNKAWKIRLKWPQLVESLRNYNETYFKPKSSYVRI